MPAWTPHIRTTIIKGKPFMQADWRESGKRQRKTFAHRADLDVWLREKRDERRAMDELRRVEGRNHAVVRLSSLDPEARASVAEALAIIGNAGGRPHHLVDAAKTFAQSHLVHAGARPVLDAVNDFLEAKERARKRERTIDGYRRLLTPFGEHFTDRPIHQLTLTEIESWMREASAGPSTWNHLRVALSGLFNHAVKRGWADGNPAAKLDRHHEERGLPAVLTPADVRALLDAAARIDKTMIPHYIVGIFAGLRPDNELRNLDWRNVNLAEGFIRVEAATAKTKRRRDVPLADNAAQWLRLHAQVEGPLFYSRRKHRKIVEAAKVTWAKDIMRHSYGSYLLAQTENEATVASRMGNSIGIVHSHYKNLRTAREAAEFWAITPRGEGGAIPFPQRQQVRASA